MMIMIMNDNSYAVQMDKTLPSNVRQNVIVMNLKGIMQTHHIVHCTCIHLVLQY